MPELARLLTPRSVHLCIDVQRLFTGEGPWATPWLERTLPVITELSHRFRARTVFTRFLPPQRPEDRPGAWQIYYQRWKDVTLERLDPRLLCLVPPLARLVPPAAVVDKRVYSPFVESGLPLLLRRMQADSIAVTGAETDICVLAAVLGAVDRGYRVVVIEDAVCSSSDSGHDAVLTLYRERLREQIEVANAEAVLSAWDLG